jgi:tricorn protease interacting factor F2/3
MKRNAANSGKQHQTLGGNVRPILYTLDFMPNLKTFRYSASESIRAFVSKKTRGIALNAKELQIKKAAVVSGAKEQGAKVRYDDRLERIMLSFPDPVSGEIEIRIEFTGIHNDKMYGFYRSMYRSKGKAKYILSSQFEAANARNAFPCFDEPEFKAVFRVSMTVEKGLDCISNMPAAKTTDLGKGMKRVQFHPTPIMSSYLLYLGVGNYDYAHGKAASIRVRVITTPGNGRLARLPMKYAIDSIKFYEKYFGIRYPLPKVDFLAIPDFAAGAMENWGAITFREAELLINEQSAVAVKQRVAEVIAHELAHQWFGDLVTMKWWNDLWLNESFATFMSYKAMDATFPEWKVKIDYLTEVIAVAFGADQLKSTHPISVHVDSPAQIDQIFDEISYEKGGTVLNMIEDYAGPDAFRKGLHGYLKAHAYSNATRSDLWGSIEKAAGHSSKGAKVQKVASYWIEKPGYPVIDVARGPGGFRLRQKRFFLLEGTPSALTWPIPVHYSVSGREGKMLMERSNASIDASNGDWIKLNLGQSGLYRVTYGDDELAALGEMISGKKLGSVDAWGVEQDVFSRSRSGRASASKYLDFAQRYCFNSDYPLSSNVLGHLGWIHDMLYYKNNPRPRDLLIKFASELVSRLGWSVRKGEPPSDTHMRSAAILEAGMAGHRPTIDKARSLFNGFINNGIAIDPNIRGAVYAIGVWTGGKEDIDVMRARFEKESLPEEKNRLLRAISMPSDPRLITESLEYSLTDKVRLQDAYAIPAITSSTPVGRRLMLGWTMDNWRSLMNRYPSGTHMLPRYIANLGILGSAQDRDAVWSFFRDKKNYRPDLKQALDNAVEQIGANCRFMKANE